MRRFCSILLLLLATHCWATNVYIDPGCIINGNGNTQSCADGENGPRNSWLGIEYSPGNSYLGRAGADAHYENCNFLISADGTDTNNQITVGSYGTGKHRIICDEGYVFGAVQRSWLTVRDLEISATNGQCILLMGSDNVTISNVDFKFCAGYGIGLDGANETIDHDHLTISGNTFIETGSSAIAGNPEFVNTQDWSHIRITGNRFEAGISSLSPFAAPAISFKQVSNLGYVYNNTISDLVIDNNTFVGVNFGANNPSYLILVSRSPFPSNPWPTKDHSNCPRNYSIFGASVHDNTATDIGGGIGVHFSAGTSITRNLLFNFRATSVIGLFFSENMYTGENVIDEINTGAFAEYWDGIGIDYDYCTRNGIIARNYISNAHGSDVDNADWNGQGIAVFAADTHKIYSNVLTNNRFGVTFGNDNLTEHYGANHLFNNTIVNSQRDAISTRFSTEQENEIYNNIIAFSQRFGLRADGIGQQHLSNNLFFANATADIESNNPDNATVEQDPGLVGGSGADAYRILSSSPAYRAGFPVRALFTDYDGLSRPAPPSIGAFEPLQ